MLAFDVAQIGQAAVFRRPHFCGFGAGQGFDAVEMGGNGGEAVCAVCFHALHYGGLCGVFRRHDEGAFCLFGLPGHRRCAAYRPQQAGEGEFAGKFVGGQFFGGNLAGGGEDAEGDGQVEAAGFFGQVGGGEVDGDFFCGELEAALDDGGAHAVAAFLHFGVGQADDVELRQAVGQMGFHFHGRGVHAFEGAAVDDGECHALSFLMSAGGRLNAFRRPAFI